MRATPFQRARGPAIGEQMVRNGDKGDAGSLSKETSNKVARPRRFERPALCFGGTRSIQLSYGRAEKRLFYCNAKARILVQRYADRIQPLARSLIWCASFSISSAFLTRARESVVVESVLSTCSFSCDARSNSFSTFFLMS